MNKTEEVYRGKSSINYQRELFTDNFGTFIKETWNQGGITLSEAVYVDTSLADFAYFLRDNDKNRNHLDIIKTINHNHHHKEDTGLVLYLNEKNQLTKTEEIKKISSKPESQGLQHKQ